MKPSRRVYVMGVGMTQFTKPGERDYTALALEAARAALDDAGVAYPAIEQVFVGYVYGESTSGQRAIQPLGLTGVPVVNVNNNCATGSTALYLGWQAVGGGMSECVLALGFEKMEKGPLTFKWGDRTFPLDRHLMMVSELEGLSPAPPTAQLFGGAAREHMRRYGTSRQQLAKIAVKNRRHAEHNRRSQFREPMTVEQVLASPMIHDPLTKLQCSPTSDGAAAAVLMSEEAVRRFGRTPRVRLEAMALTTDFASTFEDRSLIKICGYDLSRQAARRVYHDTGWGPEDFQVVELHDCFSSNELITYEALGLCSEGEGGRLLDSDAVTYGGRWVVNPSGGLLSKGHPLGATGLAQCCELVEQLRGQSGRRQVEGARRALQHNLGLGGACVVAAYACD